MIIQDDKDDAEEHQNDDMTTATSFSVRKVPPLDVSLSSRNSFKDKL